MIVVRFIFNCLALAIVIAFILSILGLALFGILKGLHGHEYLLIGFAVGDLYGFCLMIFSVNLILTIVIGLDSH